jgi:hypothetical protein
VQIKELPFTVPDICKMTVTPIPFVRIVMRPIVPAARAQNCAELFSKETPGFVFEYFRKIPFVETGLTGQLKEVRIAGSLKKGPPHVMGIPKYRKMACYDVAVG